MYFRSTLSLTDLPMEETRDSKEMLLKITIDEEKRGHVVRVSCLCLHLGRSTRKRMLLLPGGRGSGK